jgi:hypothetical protein
MEACQSRPWPDNQVSVVALVVIDTTIVAIAVISFVSPVFALVPAAIMAICTAITPPVGIGQDGTGGSTQGTADDRTLDRLVAHHGTGDGTDGTAPDGGMGLLVRGTGGQGQTQG